MKRWPKQKVRFFLCVGILTVALLWMGYIIRREMVHTISELAYDANPLLGHTVYIEESGVPKPYLVLTNDYNDSGNTLLLRKFLMPELRFFNRQKPQPSAYYNGSTIDLWLNGEFLDSLDGITPVPSTINIMVKEALGCTGRETEDIVRGVFFLSYGEVGSRDRLVIRANGKKLAYFWIPIKRRARIEGGSFTGWFLRSSSTWLTDSPAVVGRDGSTGNGYVAYKLGVRPAFCLDSTTEVVLENLPNIGRVFVIKKA